MLEKAELLIPDILTIVSMLVQKEFDNYFYFQLI